MPLLVRVDTPPSVPDPVVVQPGIGQDHPKAVWITPDNTTWDLSNVDLGWFTMSGPGGLGTIPLQHSTDADPDGGVTLQHAHVQQRYLTWPLYIEGRTHAEFLARWHALEAAFLATVPVPGMARPGTLRIIRPDGTSRQIAAVFEAGFDMPPGQGSWHVTEALTLLCPKPYWQAPTVEKAVFRQPDPIDYYDPYAGISSGQVLGEATVVNRGDAHTWPTLTVTGPAVQVTATNHTVGQTYVLDLTRYAPGGLAEGETATVVSRPIQVRGPSGEKWPGVLNWPQAQVWPLAARTNRIDLAVDGATSATEVRLEWTPRWRTA